LPSLSGSWQKTRNWECGKGWAHFAAQGPLYVATLLVLFALSVTGAAIRRERFHRGLGLFFLVYMPVFISINRRVLT
jgi:hypothetical protein